MSALSYIDLQDMYAAWLESLSPAEDRIPFAEWCARLGEPGSVQ